MNGTRKNNKIKKEMLAKRVTACALLMTMGTFVVPFVMPAFAADEAPTTTAITANGNYTSVVASADDKLFNISTTKNYNKNDIAHFSKFELAEKNIANMNL